MNKTERTNELYSEVTVALKMFIGILAMSKISFSVNVDGDMFFVKDDIGCKVEKENLQKLYEECSE